jgi:hypothetical protein
MSCNSVIALLLCVGLSLLGVGCSGHHDSECILFDFESDAALDQVIWQCHTLFALCDLHATHGNFSLKMDLFPSSHPGFSFKPSQENWSGYQSLCFDLYNPQQTILPLAVRIDDRDDCPDYPDRYNAGFSFNPGMNHFVLPLRDLVTSGSHKPLDLKRIYRFLVFMVNPSEKATLYLDCVRLSP